MSVENPNKYIIDKFINDAKALLEQEGTFTYYNMLADVIYKITNINGITFDYKKIIDEDDSNNFYIVAKSDLMQEYHSLSDI